MNIATKLHVKLVHRGRVEVLAEEIAALLPRDATVLDVGSGDGLLAVEVMRLRPDVSIDGLEVMARPNAHIPVRIFDGHAIPAADGEYDVVMIVDVLHHLNNQAELMAELARVAKHHVVIKDHLADGFGSWPLLRFMDYIGNRHAGVALPYKYLRKSEWHTIFAGAGLTIGAWNERIQLYPWFANWLFGRRLHFCARVDPVHSASKAKSLA